MSASTPRLLTDRFIKSYLSALDCPRALTVFLLYESGEHDQLSQLEINPLGYSSPKQFRDAYLATKFLSKADFLSTTFDRKKVALEKFRACEAQCASITRSYLNDAWKSNHAFEWVRSAAIRTIEKVLCGGDFEDATQGFDPEELVDLAGWGPGVTLDTKRDTSDVNKFHREGGITRDAYNLVGSLLSTAYPLWDVKFRIHDANKVITVPKNSKTDRVIAVEPGINLWFQKGIGSMIRKRLLRVGIDLNDQRRNGRLACLSSKTNHLATVDFSSASDTISRATVEDLLPPRWYSIMSAFRSVVGCVDGVSTTYAKFSSMGNGYTFELETLIFYALAVGTCKYLGISTREISVYGDDVIIPVDAFDLYSTVCTAYGFTINAQKSYRSGYFRESCGEYYYYGVNCKPYFLKGILRGEREIYLSANGVRRLARGHLYYGCDSRFRRCWQLLRASVRSPCLIAEGYGDGGFIVNFDEAAPAKAKREAQTEGFFARALLPTPKQQGATGIALLNARLWKRSVDRSLGNYYDLRNHVKYKRKRVLIHQWHDLGPWF